MAETVSYFRFSNEKLQAILDEANRNGPLDGERQKACTQIRSVLDSRKKELPATLRQDGSVDDVRF